MRTVPYLGNLEVLVHTTHTSYLYAAEYAIPLTKEGSDSILSHASPLYSVYTSVFETDEFSLQDCGEIEMQ